MNSQEKNSLVTMTAEQIVAIIRAADPKRTIPAPKMTSLELVRGLK